MRLKDWFEHFLGRFKCSAVLAVNDPWGGDEDNKSSSSPPKNKGEQPPDLEEFFANLLNRKPSDKQDDEEHSGGLPPRKTQEISSKYVLLGGIALAVIWMLSGFYTVNERENGVETLLGRYITTTHSGLNWNWPYPLGRVEKVDVQSIATMRVGEFKTQKGSVSTQDQREGQMLTKDENIVEIGAAVQYRVSDARAYLYRANDPIAVLRDVVTSALREVVGANSVDDVLTDRRNEWPQEAKQIIVSVLNQYDIGIEVVAFELQDARAPVEVQDAFEDAVRAREDEERLRLEAEAYARKRLPIARGDAEQRLQDAKAYAFAVEENAKAQAQRFEHLLLAYQQDKSALRTRLYLDTLNQVYSHSRKVLSEDDNARPIINLSEAVKQVAPAKTTDKTVLPVVIEELDTQEVSKKSVDNNARSHLRTRTR